MDDHKLIGHAMATIPAGYGKVTDGKVLPDDMIWDWVSRKWYPANADGWTVPVPDNVADCMVVARSGRGQRYATGRNYSVKRGPEPVVKDSFTTDRPEPVRPRGSQNSLF